MFVGRAQELGQLNAALDTRQAALIVVTGRRRLGKSRLIREACKGRSVIYLSASEETARLGFETFKRTCITHLGEEAGIERQTEWLGLLSCVAMTARATPGLVIVLDNFPTLCDGDENIPLAIRTFWQSGLPAAANLKLILSGSNITRMTDLVRGTPGTAQHALAGCKAQLIDLAPLPPHDARQFFPDYTDEARIAAYAIFGGIPAYLEACRPDRPLRVNIIELLLSPGGRLVDEPMHLLSAELRDIKVYAGIVRAISNGYRESGDIRSFVIGPHSGVSISSYLEKLRLMRLVRDIRAIDASPKARYIRFAVSDPLTRFYNLFVQPNRTAVEQGEGATLFDTAIKHQLGEYMMQGFEDICREFVRHNEKLFESPVEVMGQAWGSGYDIAMAGRLADNRPIFGASEWHTRAVGLNGLDYLMQQAALSLAASDARPLIGQLPPQPGYVLFSRSGFTTDVRDRAKSFPALKLVTPSDIIAAG